MLFKMKYEIIQDYIPVRKGDKGRRSGNKMPKVGFGVLHDTGNDGSTAKGNVSYFKRSADEISASAHIFVDDKHIIECVPLLTGTPEKAWHVLYQKPTDNIMFGDDANDIAGGFELCYSHKEGSINNEEAYKRYVWVVAYFCHKFNLDPKKYLVGHHILDPQRKTDPINALSKMGKTYEQLIIDIDNEMKECMGQAQEVVKTVTPVKPVVKSETVVKSTSINETIEMGDRNDSVKEAQRILNTKGYKLTIDGIFGKNTDDAVRDFQEANGLIEDGIVGAKTWAKLNAKPKVVETAKYGIANGNVWLHKTPDFNGSSQTVVLKKGERVQIISKANAHMFETNRGFVSAKYINLVNEPHRKFGVATGDVWLHKTPDFNSTSKTVVLKEGQKVEITGDTGKMYKTTRGYVSKKYIRV